MSSYILIYLYIYNRELEFSSHIPGSLAPQTQKHQGFFIFISPKEPNLNL